MYRKIEIVVISNAGLLIRTERARILIDGIYEIQNSGNRRLSCHDPFQAKDLFTPVPEEIMTRIVNGKEEFSGIDAVLFSHYHRDHYSGPRTVACLKGNPIGALCLPEDRLGESAIVRAEADAAGVRVVDMLLPVGVKGEQVFGDIRVRYYRTPHCSDMTEVNHYSFLITIGERQIYISSDADHTDRFQKEMLEGEHVDVAFFNPLHFQLRSGRQLMSLISPDRAIMYHVPFEEDDRYGFRRLSERIMTRYRDSLPPCEIIAAPLQVIAI